MFRILESDYHLDIFTFCSFILMCVWPKNHAGFGLCVPGRHVGYHVCHSLSFVPDFVISLSSCDILEFSFVPDVVISFSS